VDSQAALVERDSVSAAADAVGAERLPAHPHRQLPWVLRFAPVSNPADPKQPCGKLAILILIARGGLKLRVTLVVAVGVQGPASPDPLDINGHLGARTGVAITVQHISVELMRHVRLRWSSNRLV
jgi:hypothetical protein